MLFHGTRREERAVSSFLALIAYTDHFRRSVASNDFGVHRNSQLSPHIIDARPNQPASTKSSRTTRPGTAIQVTRVIFGAFARKSAYPPTAAE